MNIMENGIWVDSGSFCGSAHLLGFSNVRGKAYGLTAGHNFYLRKKHKLTDDYAEYFATRATFYPRKTEAEDPYECRVIMDSI